jgi:transcriptional regulator with PAS, ATPase and Fis domain
MGTHPRLDEVRRFAVQVARVPGARVLITGESGTGKSLLARTIHALSEARGRFVEVNCAALPAHLLESELFGHERGAFTDARAMKRGLIEVAHGGTLFLDEIGAMPIELQAKLLLFMEAREIRRVGGEDSIEVDVRVIAATNVDLRRMVAERAFREDLLYRLDVATVEMPPLREMPEVIAQLAGRFVRELSATHGRAVPEITPASFQSLADYDWPGNARELRNAVERALIFREDRELVVHPPARSSAHVVADGSLRIPLGLSLEEVERRYIEEALAEDPRRDLAEVASRLGISRKTLWEKRKRYGL